MTRKCCISTSGCFAIFLQVIAGSIITYARQRSQLATRARKAVKGGQGQALRLEKLEKRGISV